jgi:hypothetical protein
MDREENGILLLLLICWITVTIIAILIPSKGNHDGKFKKPDGSPLVIDGKMISRYPQRPG